MSRCRAVLICQSNNTEERRGQQCEQLATYRPPYHVEPLLCWTHAKDSENAKRPQPLELVK